jgi:hypothetical protein
VLPVYGLLVGALLGLGLGGGAWELLATHGQPECVALTAGGERCTGGTTPERWAYLGGGTGAGVGLTAGVVVLVRRRRTKRTEPDVLESTHLRG